MTTAAPVGPLPTGSGPAPHLDWDETLADIGDRIRAERQARHLSRDQLADQSGLTRAMIRTLESGQAITLRSLLMACHALDVPVEHLLSDAWTLPDRGVTLPPRQAEVLLQAADGAPLSVVAGRLGVDREAVAAHLSMAYRRLGVADVPQDRRRAAAVRVAREHRLFD